MTAINEVYPNDAQLISDPEWVKEGCARGWAGLAKDKKLRRSAGYHAATRPIFALSNGNLGLNAMVNLFDAHRDRIWRMAHATRREFWIVYEDEVKRRDP